MDPNYSIIIPHKDIPDLLQRCLDSIPLRDDVQVIVVDDNSDPKKVDFAHFPQWKGKQYEYHLTKEGKGAGFARNVGLEHAKGRWIVFADADDFFTEDFNGLLDEMADAEEDMVYFDYINVLSDDITRQVEDRKWYSKFLAAYRIGEMNEAVFRTMIPVVWCRMIKREFVERNGIRFSETRWSNDLHFAAQVGSLAKAVKVSDRIGYVVTSREGSLTKDFCGTAEELRVRLKESLKSEKTYAQHLLPCKGRMTSACLAIAYKKKGFLWCARFALTHLGDWPVAKVMFAFLAKRILRGEVVL